jgi:hypothetical protein
MRTRGRQRTPANSATHLVTDVLETTSASTIRQRNPGPAIPASSLTRLDDQREHDPDIATHDQRSQLVADVHESA